MFAPHAPSTSSRGRRGGVARSDVAGAAQEWLLGAVDLALAGAIFLAPLVLGGRHPIGSFVLTALVCLGAVAWLLRQSLVSDAVWRRSPADGLILAGLGLFALQLTPLAPDAIAWLSPKIPQLLPLWTPTDAGFQLGVWRTLSLSPDATREGLVAFLTFALLFQLVLQRTQTTADVDRLLMWIALAAVGMAALGLAQYLAPNGKFLWIYEHPSRSTYGVARGAFANQNHFANFLMLGLAPLAVWIDRLLAVEPGDARRRQRSHASGEGRQALLIALAFGLGCIVLAGLLTFSRGGLLAMFTSGAVLLAVGFSRGMLQRRWLAPLAAVAAVLLLAISFSGYEQLADRFGDVAEARSLSDLSAGRQRLWAALGHAVRDFPLVGTGVGSHREIYPVYMEADPGVEYTHAESGYLHVLVESGAVGLALLLIGVACALYWSLSVVRGAERRDDVLRGAAILAGLTASALHSLADFVWCIPACLTLTLVLAACACRLHQLQSPRESAARATPIVWRLAAGLAIAAAWMMLARAWAPAAAAVHWDRYLRMSLAAEKSPTSGVDFDPHMLATVETMLGHLERAAACDPHDARIAARLAALRLRQFNLVQLTSDNVMLLVQIRDAALASQFPSRQDQDAWLAAALGDNRARLDASAAAARRAVRLCPLQGEVYTYLAELSFLDSPQPALKRVYLDQALRVRPQHGAVLLTIGQEAALAGDFAGAQQAWRRALRLTFEKRTIVATLAPLLSGEQFLEQFDPDEAGLRVLYTVYLQRKQLDDARIVARRLAPLLAASPAPATPRRRTDHYRQLVGMNRLLGDVDQATLAAQRLVEVDSGSVTARALLADLLVQQGRFDAALEHLQAAERRRPGDPEINKVLQRLQAARRQSAAAEIESAAAARTQR